MKMYATAAFLAAAMAAQAQDPFDPGQSGQVEYASAFERYQRFREEQGTPWQAANEEMKRIGGHAGHLGMDRASAPAGQAQEMPARQQDGRAPAHKH
ncbi:MAG: hypothetical protein ACOZB1_10290 [Pseudomonadota bacterium]|jgi:hypothetical protein